MPPQRQRLVRIAPAEAPTATSIWLATAVGACLVAGAPLLRSAAIDAPPRASAAAGDLSLAAAAAAESSGPEAVAVPAIDLDGEPARAEGAGASEASLAEGGGAGDAPQMLVAGSPALVTATATPRLGPRREYPVPAPRPGAVWPFTSHVYRWQPLVEAELDAVRRQRPVDPLVTVELVLAVIAAESGGDPLAVSPADACGLMQLMPATFRDLIGDADVFDPQLNVRAGVLYLHRALAQHQGQLDWALVSYNAGPTVAARARWGDGQVYGVTETYVGKVYDLLERALALRAVAPTPPPLAFVRPSATLGPLTPVPSTTAVEAATPTETATETPTETLTATPAATQTVTVTPTATASATGTATQTATLTPTATARPSATVAPGGAPGGVPGATASASPRGTATPPPAAR